MKKLKRLLDLEFVSKALQGTQRNYKLKMFLFQKNNIETLIKDSVGVIKDNVYMSCVREEIFKRSGSKNK